MSSYIKEICKVTDNQLVFPIKDYENIGDSLSSINYNFNVLDVYTCNFEFSANNKWNTAYTLVNQNSAGWIDTINTVKSNSSCWTDTYTTVNRLSSLWMKPISMIYPYPFEETGENSSIISEITSWLNTTLPVLNEKCSNFIVGQELYVFTPLYSEINRILTQTKTIGVKTVKVKFFWTCIGKGVKVAYPTGSVDCGSSTLEVAVPDKYVNQFKGLKYIVDPETLTWQFDSALFD
jgi:hypothetical protein